MRYDFYADKTDKLDVLDFVFNETDLEVFDLSSPYGENICQYKSSEELVAKFSLASEDKVAVYFQLWSPRHRGKPVFSKVSLDPRRCNGHTFRYATGGWGMIQLYFGSVKHGILSLSHIGHFSQKDAAKREGVNKAFGSINDWKWDEVQTTSKRLKQHIRNKLAVAKLGTLDILPKAAKLQEQGIELR